VRKFVNDRDIYSKGVFGVGHKEIQGTKRVFKKVKVRKRRAAKRRMTYLTTETSPFLVTGGRKVDGDVGTTSWHALRWAAAPKERREEVDDGFTARTKIGAVVGRMEKTTLLGGDTENQVKKGRVKRRTEHVGRLTHPTGG